MFESLINAITDWPVLLQGAIGSALFWLVLLLGQKCVSVATSKLSSKSRIRRKSFLMEQSLKYAYKLTKDNGTRAAITSGLIYRALRNTIRACIWLTLGLVVSAILPVFGIVGFLGALFYFFEALNTITTVPETDDAQEKIKQLTKELKELEEA